MALHDNLQFDVKSFDLFSSQSFPLDQHIDTAFLVDRQECEILKPILWFQLYCYLLRQFDLNFEEENMFNPKLIRLLILDLVGNHGYTFMGIASDTHIPEEVIEEIAYGINTNPSSIAFVRILMVYIMNKPSGYTEKIRRMLQQLEYGYVNFKTR